MKNLLYNVDLSKVSFMLANHIFDKAYMKFLYWLE